MDRVVSVCDTFDVNTVSTMSRPAKATATWLLQRAGTFVSQPATIQAAMQLGMPLHAVEQYLDWLEQNPPLRVGARHPLPCSS
jgi:hypothetical protein